MIMVLNMEISCAEAGSCNRTNNHDPGVGVLHFIAALR